MITLTPALGTVNPIPAGWGTIEPCTEIEDAAYLAWLDTNAEVLAEQAEMSDLVETFVRF